jgi:hypothetical protein
MAPFLVATQHLGSADSDGPLIPPFCARTDEFIEMKML